MKSFCLARALKCVLIVTLVVVAVGWVVMSLWNGLLPGLFGWPTLSFVQAIGLLALTRILFGGLRGGGCGPGKHWRRHMLERSEQMTPEEREKLRTGLRNRCGPWGARDQE